MVLDLGISQLPMWLFMVVHLTAFALGAYFAYRAFGLNRTAFGWGFSLYALAEVLYMGYHLGISTFLLSHTLAEVANLVAFALIFTGIVQTATQPRAAAAHA